MDLSPSDKWDLLLVIFGGVISLAGSLLVTHLYYRKSKPVERMLQSITENLRRTLVRSRFPEFFESKDANILFDRGFQSSRPDTPQVDEVILDRAIIYPGNKVNVLLKVVDMGLNFRNPEGATVKDHHGNSLKVDNVGFGYMRFAFQVKDTDAPASYKISVDLADEDEYGQPKSRESKQLSFRVNRPGG